MIYDYPLPDKGVLHYTVEKDKLTDEQYISIHSATNLQTGAIIEIPSEINNVDLGKTLSVKTIGDNAFEDAEIASVILPKTIKTIFSCAFLNSKIESINLPEGLTFLSTSVFRDCRNLKEITIPSTLNVIKEHTFTNCSRLTKVNFQEGLKYIFYCAFKYTGISSLNFPDSLTVIGESAFESCEVKDINFGKGLVTIHNDAFYGCCQLEAVKFQEGISEICEGAFNYCENLRSFVLPDSLQKLNNEVLDNCENLIHVHLGKNTEIVKNNDFCFSCNSLEKITISPENKQYKIIDGVLYDAVNGILLRVPPSLDRKVITVPSWVDYFENNSFNSVLYIEKVKINSDIIQNLNLSGIEEVDYLIICCHPDSQVKEWAEGMDIPTMPLSSKINRFLENVESENINLNDLNS